MASCLLVIDVQKGFLNATTRHIPSLIEGAQNDYDYLIATQFYNPPDSFFRTLIGWHGIERDSKDFPLAFTPRKDAILVEKPTYSCVNPSFLNLLQEKKIDVVHIGGIDTDICVMKCAVDLIESGKTPQVLTKLCASTAGFNHHEAAIQILRRYIGKNQVI